MQVSVETLSGLERKVIISVPSDKVEEEVKLRLRSFAPKAKIHGFRAGKVPPAVIKQRFSDSIRQEVARDMVQPTLFEALKDHKLQPAGAPEIEPMQVEEGKPFTYSAIFEIYPEIAVNELTKEDKVEVVRSAVTDDDLTIMLDNLRAKHKNWQSTSRPVVSGDKVIINFKGFLNEEAFEGGAASNYEVIVGAGSMIPGFEEGLIGAEKDVPFEINVNFPDDYGHEALAGKKALFKITAVDILEGTLPDLDASFAEKFNITDGGIEALKKDIKENMVRELERRVSSMNRGIIFDKLLAKNTFDLPTSLVEQEIDHLKHEMYHHIFGNHHAENETIPDFPRVLFEEKARHRVQLGLLFSEYVDMHKIVVDAARVDAMIENMASAYDKPDELRATYKVGSERRSEIEALVMEDIVSEKIIETASTTEKVMNYDEVVNPEKGNEDQGA